jgi:hypothetical protein
MVHVSSYKQVETKEGRSFISLELTGGLELVQSSNNGRFYATVRKCKIPSTFDANIAMMMLGQKIEGEIVRVAVEPYDFTNKLTGEIITLQHSYAYQPTGSMELIGQSQVTDLEMV